MTTSRPTLMIAALLVLAGAALAGCSSAGSQATPTSQSPTTETTSVATPTPAPTEADAASCDTVLTEEATAQLAADGLEQVEVGESTFYAIADDLIAAGGLACKWGRPSSDVSLTVVQLSGIDVAASEWPAALAAAGYTETGDPVAGAYSGPADPGTGVPSVVLVMPESLTFVSTPTHAVDVAPAA